VLPINTGRIEAIRYLRWPFCSVDVVGRLRSLINHIFGIFFSRSARARGGQPMYRAALLLCAALLLAAQPAMAGDILTPGKFTVKQCPVIKDRGAIAETSFGRNRDPASRRKKQRPADIRPYCPAHQRASADLHEMRIPVQTGAAAVSSRSGLSACGPEGRDRRCVSRSDLRVPFGPFETTMTGGQCHSQTASSSRSLRPSLPPPPWV
jgi:hypothetical protein